jgi:hypothetical protein
MNKHAEIAEWIKTADNLFTLNRLAELNCLKSLKVLNSLKISEWLKSKPWKPELTELGVWIRINGITESKELAVIELIVLDDSPIHSRT